MEGPNQYLSDFENDPGEQDNLAITQPNLVSEFQHVVAEWQQQNDSLAEQVSYSPCQAIHP